MKKKILSVLICFVMLASLLPQTQLFASAETSGDFSYYVTYDNKAKITDYTGSATELVIPATLGGYPVTSIGSYAFSSCESLASVTIPDSVTSIGSRAFVYCSNLASVTIPSSVTSIGNYAFAGCLSLADVYYTGSAEDWAEIAIGSDNAELTDATMHYSGISVIGVTLNKTSVTLAIGDMETLVATVSPSNATNADVTWKSSDNTVATVVGNGLVVANSGGTAIITVTTKDGGKTATCTITVKGATTIYSFAQSTQIGLIEPWFLKANALVYTDSTYPINYNALVDYGAYFIRKSELSDTSLTQATITNRDILNNPNAVKYSKKAGTAGIDGSYITALYNSGIYTYQLDSNAYVMFYVKDADGYHYGDVKVRNAKTVAETIANDTTTNYGDQEKVVCQDMIDMYETITAYRANFFN